VIGGHISNKIYIQHHVTARPKVGLVHIMPTPQSNSKKIRGSSTAREWFFMSGAFSKKVDFIHSKSKRAINIIHKH